MGQLTPILTKNYKAGAIVYPKRIVKFGADDKTVILATGATDRSIGVVDNVGYDTANTNNRYPNPDVNIYLAGLAPIVYGGTIARGDWITPDANGKGVKATLGGGVRAIGIAMEDGVAGDEGTVFILPVGGTTQSLGFTTVSTITTDGVVTYTAAQLLGGLILRDPNGAGRSDVSPTAALIVAAVSGVVGSSFEFVIRNDADAAETITLTAGTGVTLSGTMTIAQSNAKRFRAVITNVGSGTEAVTIYSLGTSVF